MHGDLHYLWEREDFLEVIVADFLLLSGQRIYLSINLGPKLGGNNHSDALKLEFQVEILG